MADRYIEYLALDTIPLAIRNPKGHAAKVIRESIDRHGFAEAPMIDERTGRLIAGHGRFADLETRRAAGEGAPDDIKVDAEGRWLVPVQRGWASRDDAEAEAYLLTSNQASIAGGWIDAELAPLIIDLQAGPGLAGVGFTTDDLDEPLRPSSGCTPPRNR